MSKEADGLRAGLEAETQKSALLQEEINVQAAQPEALAKRLQEVSAMNEAEQEEQLNNLAGVILAAFRASIPADEEGGVTYPVAISVLKDNQEILSVTYSLTKAQETQAYEAAEKINESQALYRIDLNHSQTAALVVNGTAIDKQTFQAAYAEAFNRNPKADEATLNKLATEEAVKTAVLRQHAEAIGLDADAQDAETKLWEAALENVAVSDGDFSAALAERQEAENNILSSDPAEYARMLEEGEIASPELPEGSRFVKQLIVPVNFSALEELLPQLNTAQKRLSEVNEIVYGPRTKNYSSSEIQAFNKERDDLAKQVSRLNNQRKELQETEKKAETKANDLARKLRKNPESFEDIAAQAKLDEGMPAVGYAVFKGAVKPDSALVAAALALENQGSVSEPIKMKDGYHILFYSEEITADSATVQQAQEALRQELLEQLLKTTQEDLLLKWISEANVVSNVD